MEASKPRITRESLDGLDPTRWGTYASKATIRAYRMEGAFEVQGTNGEVTTCEDGYIVLDAQQGPVAFPREGFENTYEVSDKTS